MKIQCGEKANKCNRCKFVALYKCDLETHIEMHSGIKSHKCNHFKYASYQSAHMKAHKKMYSGEICTNTINVNILHHFITLISFEDIF